MTPIEITSVEDSRIKVFAGLTEAQLRNSLHPEEGMFIAESPKVIKVALDSGMIPTALLCEHRHIDGDAADIIARIPDVPIYTGSRETLAAITGYTLTRGVLCAMRRPLLPSVESLCKNAGRVVVIDDVSDTTNIGAIFRSAAALGIDAVLLTPTACDPLNRRAIRVSMGSVFLIPWTRLDGGLKQLKAFGFKTVAMALRHNSVDISDPILKKESKLAIIMGTEGEGLPLSVIDSADYVVKIPMHHGVDSLNVAAASAIAFYELARPKNPQSSQLSQLD
ncbi:MAG: RNA methyltransferase [Muribaculaceae bacterium]|nr:RNA methyltransferase [Muribaculaceae bacterium]